MRFPVLRRIWIAAVSASLLSVSAGCGHPTAIINVSSSAPPVGANLGNCFPLPGGGVTDGNVNISKKGGDCDGGEKGAFKFSGQVMPPKAGGDDKK
jgi:hypothetical protein